MKKILVTIVGILAVLVLLNMGIGYSVRSSKPYSSVTNADTAEKMISIGNYIIIDVRSEEEYKEEHIVGAIHIPMEELKDNLSSYEDLVNGKDVIIYSNDGKEADSVCKAIIKSELAGVVEIGESDTISLGKEATVPITEETVAAEAMIEELETEELTIEEPTDIVQPIIRYINFPEIDVCIAESEVTATPIELSLVSENGNGISEIQDWFAPNELSIPVIDGTFYKLEPREDAPKLDDSIVIYDTAFYDENYIYHWSPSSLEIYERDTCELLYSIGYETDKWYLMGNCACLRDGILYIGSQYNGYARPNTCFLVAYDIEKDEVIWRSEDQTYNSMNFIVKDDVIICGYGFTSEKDYIYQIDIHTGAVISKTELKKMPDMLVEKDGQLYVHTYSYDYVFDMK